MLTIIDEIDSPGFFKVRKVQITYIPGGGYEIKDDIKYLENLSAHEQLEWAAKGYSVSKEVGGIPDRHYYFDKAIVMDKNIRRSIYNAGI